MNALTGLLAAAWWSIRGVGVDEYRHTCVRCGKTGQAHWLSWCVRFKPVEQRTWCWCPGCKVDLCSQDDALIDDTCGPEELVWYRCTKCGQHSLWNFNHLTPFIVSKEPWLTDNVEWLPFNSRSRR